MEEQQNTAPESEPTPATQEEAASQEEPATQEVPKNPFGGAPATPAPEGLSHSEVNRIVARTKLEAQAAGKKAALEELLAQTEGAETADELIAAWSEKRELEEAAQSELENERQAKAKAEAKAEKIQKERDEARAKYEASLKTSALERALVAEGVRPDRVEDAALYGARLAAISLDEDEKVQGHDQAAKATKEKYPEWFGSQQPVPGGGPRDNSTQTNNPARSYLNKKYASRDRT